MYIYVLKCVCVWGERQRVIYLESGLPVCVVDRWRGNEQDRDLPVLFLGEAAEESDHFFKVFPIVVERYMLRRGGDGAIVGCVFVCVCVCGCECCGW